MNGGSRAWSLVMALVAALVFCGAFVLARRHPAPPLRELLQQRTERPVGTSGSRATSPAQAESADVADIVELRSRHLLVPVEGADVERWKGSFAETHNGHLHEAVDILAPRNTPIHAVDDGRIAKLFESRDGGLTVYQLDPTGRFIYYYAHLERYADVHDGDPVTRGEVIGYVGTSGNAPPNTPHLHFAIVRVSDPRRWWEGRPLDPYLVFSAADQM